MDLGSCGQVRSSSGEAKAKCFFLSAGERFEPDDLVAILSLC